MKLWNPTQNQLPNRTSPSPNVLPEVFHVGVSFADEVLKWGLLTYCSG
jgi:hypothetical protein